MKLPIHTTDAGLCQDLKAYRAGLRPFWAERTVFLRTYYADRFLGWCEYEELDWTALEPEHITAWLMTNGPSPHTRKSALCSARSFYKWGLQTRRCTENPAEDLPPIRPPRGVPNPAPMQALCSGFQRCTQLTDMLMLLLASYGGLRPCEICHLHTNDIDGPLMLVNGKGSKLRKVPIHPTLGKIMDRFPRGYFFYSNKNLSGHYLHSSISQRISDLLPENWTARSLRHQFATRYYEESDHDLLGLKELMGHESVATTQIYARADPNHAVKVMTSLPVPEGTDGAVRRLTKHGHLSQMIT